MTALDILSILSPYIILVYHYHYPPAMPHAPPPPALQPHLTCARFSAANVLKKKKKEKKNLEALATQAKVPPKRIHLFIFTLRR